MRKVIYLIEQPLDERNYDRFGIQSWIARGWVAEVWDLTALAFPLVWRDFLESGHKLSAFAGYFPIASQGQLVSRISALSEPACIIDLTGEKHHSRVKARLARRGAVRVTCAAGSIPSLDDEGAASVGLILRNIFSRKLFDELAYRLAASFIRPALVVVAGENSVPANRRGMTILRAHNLDYDIYMRLKRTPAASSGRYAVFLDQNICFHPEYIYNSVSPYTRPERYFPALRNGLRTISAAVEVPFKIAAHPRLPRQEQFADYFGGIPIEYGKTAELISNCEFVVCHYTTAIQYAVLFEKPVIFVTTNDLAASRVGRYIEKFASVLGRSAINLEGDLEGLDWRTELRVDSRKYREYRQKYIKTDGSPEMPHWDIVIDYMANACPPWSADSPARRMLAGRR
jgi:hypothetical protein